MLVVHVHAKRARLGRDEVATRAFVGPERHGELHSLRGLLRQRFHAEGEQACLAFGSKNSVRCVRVRRVLHEDTLLGPTMGDVVGQVPEDAGKVHLGSRQAHEGRLHDPRCSRAGLRRWKTGAAVEDLRPLPGELLLADEARNVKLLEVRKPRGVSINGGYACNRHLTCSSGLCIRVQTMGAKRTSTPAREFALNVDLC